MTGPIQAPTGVFFNEQSVDAVIHAMSRFEQCRHFFDPQATRNHVAQFDRERFKEQLEAFAMAALTHTAS